MLIKHYIKIIESEKVLNNNLIPALFYKTKKYYI